MRPIEEQDLLRITAQASNTGRPGSEPQRPGPAPTRRPFLQKHPRIEAFRQGVGPG